MAGYARRREVVAVGDDRAAVAGEIPDSCGDTADDARCGRPNRRVGQEIERKGSRIAPEIDPAQFRRLQARRSREIEAAGQRQIGAQLERGSRAGRGVVAVGDGGGRQAGRERPGANPGDRSTRLTSRSSAGRCVRKCILTGLSPLSDEQLLDVLAFDVSSALVG